ncbi:hypothetical protein BV898_19094 [Hypsibius exemplaris]|uniref:Uncharacterized protein n=1 Tax=Hypsibius exemplaris TaxID=2072580 RepID=A0A9X6RNS4_HYPEX|nr:hypothetical protein BV898_19094 [Hypsibius exemplaris]
MGHLTSTFTLEWPPWNGHPGMGHPGVGHPEVPAWMGHPGWATWKWPPWSGPPCGMGHLGIFFWASSKMFQDGVKDVFYGMVCRKRTASVEPSRFFTGTRRGTEGSIHPDHSQTRM